MSRKQKQKELKTPYWLSSVILAGSYLLFGLFKEYGACLYTGIWGILFLMKGSKISRNDRKQAWPVFCCQRPNEIVIGIIALCYFFNCFYGIDRGMSFIGFLKFMGVPLFLGYLRLLNNDEKRLLYQMIPILGCVMTVVGMIGRFIPPLYSFFYVADRLGGFFQYPNVFALFCLVGIFLLLEKRKEFAKSCRIQIILLLGGILLSGSRTVFFITVFVALLCFWKCADLRKQIIIFAVVCFGGILIYTGVTGNVQNIGRFLTTSFTSSTLLGRIIYWKDGLKELLHHPLGLGYLGYYYREPVIQTAFYSVRFIHNDFLQLALDVGMLPALLFAVMYMKMFWDKKLSFERKMALLAMLLHFFMDFDLEFVSMWYLLILITDIPGEMQPQSENAYFVKYGMYMKRVGKAFLGVLAVCGLYTGISMIPRYLGDAELTSTLLPYYTESNVELLSQETDPAKAENLAKKICRQNIYIPETYDIFAILAFQNGDYEKVIQEKEKSLSLQKYNMEAYEKYAVLLAKGINIAAENGEENQVEILMEGVKRIPKLVSEVENHTTELAYKTKDSPDFTLSEWLQEFLNEIEKY